VTEMGMSLRWHCEDWEGTIEGMRLQTFHTTARIFKILVMLVCACTHCTYNILIFQATCCSNWYYEYWRKNVRW